MKVHEHMYNIHVSLYLCVRICISIHSPSIAPSGFDEVLVEGRGSRSILLSWDEPAFPNGIIINYAVLEGGEEIAAIFPPSVEYNVTGLLPVTDYQFSVLACTTAGCVESPQVDTKTLEDGKYMSVFSICYSCTFFFLFSP